MEKHYAIPLGSLAALLLLLLALHLTLPYLVRDYLNGKLADMSDYRGHTADVDLALWHGAYRIDRLSIVKDNGKVPVPFLDTSDIDPSVSWRTLWGDRAVVARVVLEHPQLNFVDAGGDHDASQTGVDTDWHEQLDKLLPITLNEVRVVDGTLHFRSFTSKPPVNLHASALDTSIYNPTNVADTRGERSARLEGTVRILDRAPLEVAMHFNPLSGFEDFSLRLRVTQVELKRLSDFASAYDRFDLNTDTGDLVLEAQAKRGQLGGYIKPLLCDVDVFNWRQDVEDGSRNLFRSIWEAPVGGDETVLKNQRKDQFAARVSLSGNIHQQNVSAFQAFLGILHNAFVEVFNARFERFPATRDDDD